MSVHDIMKILLYKSPVYVTWKVHAQAIDYRGPNC
jgi:hypothetical protein